MNNDSNRTEAGEIAQTPCKCSRIHRAINIVAINLALIILLVVAVEWLLRSIPEPGGKTWRVEPTFSYYEMFTLRPHTSACLNIVPLPGVTSKRVTPNNPKQGRSVYLLGGSTVAGAREPDNQADSDDDTIAAHLSDIAFSNNNPMVVENFGVPNYRSTEELNKLMKLLRAGHRPDVVIFYNGFNDTEFASRGQSCYDILKPMEAAFEQDAVDQNLDVLLNHLALYRRLRSLPGVQHRIRDGVRFLVFSKRHSLSDYIRIDEVDLSTLERRKEYCVRTYFENMRMAEALSKLYGFKPFFVLQPMLYFKQNRSSAEQNVYRVLPSQLKEEIPLFYQAIEVAMSENMHFVSAKNLFAGTAETIFPEDQGHTRSAGNRLIARYLYEKIVGID